MIALRFDRVAELLSMLRGEPDRFIVVRRKGENVSSIGTRQFEIVQDRATGDGSHAHPLIAGWRFDGTTLVARSDRLGFTPLFYAASADRFVLGTSFVSVARRIDEARLDFDALSVFLRLGHFLSEDSPVTGVKVLPPDTEIRWPDAPLPGEFAPHHPAPARISRREAVRAYRALFEQAVRRRLAADARTILPISGGRDSRHLLLQLCELGNPPNQTATVRTPPPHGDEDVRVAAELTRALGVRHSVVEADYGASLVVKEIVKNELTHFCTAEHAWFLDFLLAFRDQADVLYDGLGGDVLSNSVFFNRDLLEAFRTERLDRCCRLLLGEQETLPYLCSTLRRELTLERARSRLAIELEKHVGAPNPVSSFYFWNRTRRAIALLPLCLAGRHLQIFLPYVDEDLFDFLRALPGERFGPRGFHDEVIAEAFPEQRSIPYERKEARAVPRSIASWSEQRAFFRYFRSAAEFTVHDRRFSTLRRLVAVLTRDPERMRWWMKSALYLAQLRQALDESLAPE